MHKLPSIRWGPYFAAQGNEKAAFAEQRSARKSLPWCTRVLVFAAQAKQRLPSIRRHRWSTSISWQVQAHRRASNFAAQGNEQSTMHRATVGSQEPCRVCSGPSFCLPSASKNCQASVGKVAPRAFQGRCKHAVGPAISLPRAMKKQHA